LMDYLKEGKVKKHYNEIKFIIENYHSTEAADMRALKLSNLLNHAIETSPFYRKYMGFTSLNDFPVINKISIRDKFEDLQSEEFRNKTNRPVRTSGSFGITTTTLQNANKRRRNTADTIYFTKQAGFELGYKLYYIRKRFKMHTKGPSVTWLRNIVMVDVSLFSDKYLSEFIDKLKSDGWIKALLGYSSAYTEICKYLDRQKADPMYIKISCIIAMSEVLSDYTKKSLEKYFKTPVISRNSNLENGIFSMQLPNQGNNFHVNWASYHIELLHPENDTPIKYGELGRVVITDLFNYCMPIVRYDTGDLAIMTNDHGIFN